MYVKINIDRAKGKIKYNRTQYVQAAKADEINYSALKEGEQFKLGKDEWENVMTSDELRKAYPRNKIWIKISDNKANGADGYGTLRRLTKTSQVEFYRPKKKIEKAKMMTFKQLPIGAEFVFLDMPQSLQYKNVPGKERTRYFVYDQKFKKINENQCQAGDRVVNMERMQDADVIIDKEWQKKYQYKKESLEDALDYLFSEFKTDETKWGERVIVPSKKDFDEAMRRYNVSDSKINSLSKEDKETKTWRGMFNGQEHNYVWVRTEEKEEIEVTRS
jgi:hypothetical protein